MRPGRRAFCLLLGMLALSVSAQGQTNFRFEKLDELIAFAKSHKKLIDKQYKEAQGKENKANSKANHDSNDHGFEFYSAYASEIYAYRIIKDSLGFEREILELIDRASKFRFNDQEVSNASGEAARFAGFAQTLRERAEQQEGDALVNLHNAEVRKASPKLVEILRKGLEASKGVYGYFDQQEATLNRFLAICCQTTTNEIVARREAYYKEQQARFNRWMDQRERSREAGAAVLIGLGLIPTLSRVLTSPDSSAEQVNYAKQRMRELNEQARISCMLRGGIYLGGSDISFGACSK